MPAKRVIGSDVPRCITFVLIMAAPSATLRRASPRSRHPHTNGTLKLCLLMWWMSSAGVSTCTSTEPRLQYLAFHPGMPDFYSPHSDSKNPYLSIDKNSLNGIPLRVASHKQGHTEWISSMPTFPAHSPTTIFPSCLSRHLSFHGK